MSLSTLQLLLGTGGIFAGISSIAVGQINAQASKRLEALKSDLTLKTTTAIDAERNRAQLALEGFKEELEVQKATAIGEINARRAYEFDARKRLYEDIEPLFFRLSEAVELALKRVRSIARANRDGELQTWLGQNYSTSYVTSVMYRMLIPGSITQLIRRKLTTVDLTVDPSIEVQYRLAKILYYSWTADFDLANGGSKYTDNDEREIPYDPNNLEWKANRVTNESQFWRQGLPLGRLDMACEFLIDDRDGVPPRTISYGKFFAEYESETSEIGKFAHAYLTDILQDFDPRKRPVFWRVLILQAIILSLISLIRSKIYIRGRRDDFEITDDELRSYIKEIGDYFKSEDKFRFYKEVDNPTLVEDKKQQDRAIEAALFYIGSQLQLNCTGSPMSTTGESAS